MEYFAIEKQKQRTTAKEEWARSGWKDTESGKYTTLTPPVYTKRVENAEPIYNVFIFCINFIYNFS